MLIWQSRFFLCFEVVQPLTVSKHVIKFTPCLIIIIRITVCWFLMLLLLGWLVKIELSEVTQPELLSEAVYDQFVKECQDEQWERPLWLLITLFLQLLSLALFYTLAHHNGLKFLLDRYNAKWQSSSTLRFLSWSLRLDGELQVWSIIAFKEKWKLLFQLVNLW